MSSESDIFKLFRSMTLDDASPSMKLHKEEDTSSSSSSKNKKKKEEVLRLGVKKKSKKKNVGAVEERGRVRTVNKWNEKNAVGNWRLYYGVKNSVLRRVFIAEITHPDGHLVCLGTFKSPKRAAMAYDKAALNIYGPKAALNFPHLLKRPPPPPPPPPHNS
ncbi:putative transcription factor AP2-EREBP family [Helianthus annuus]|nr:putative transcription factor AP2-EREBP family [Helianthus annuus]